MKKNYFLLIIAAAILITAIVLRLSGPEDEWLCQDGQWVKHGSPDAPQPTTLCPGAVTGNLETTTPATTTVATTTEATTTAEVEIFSPKPETLIKSPLAVLGQARGTWFFEASLPVSLTDADGNRLAIAPAQAGSDWMTTEFVPFTTSLDFVVTPTTTDTGYLVVAKDNPSGLPEHDASFRIPVRFR